MVKRHNKGYIEKEYITKEKYKFNYVTNKNCIK